MWNLSRFFLLYDAHCVVQSFMECWIRLVYLQISMKSYVESIVWRNALSALWRVGYPRFREKTRQGIREFIVPSPTPQPNSASPPGCPPRRALTSYADCPPAVSVHRADDRVYN
jgi:hypothetical protein